PRVTKPYSEEQWRHIEALGHRIDQELSSNDVRLTMGGEPTFVSIDDMDGAEWNFTALGHKKRELAGALIKRLKPRLAAGGRLHYGKGRAYPGEALRRGSRSCWWRPDGKPIWNDDSLIADETHDLGHGLSEARRFIDELTALLSVNRDDIIPAYED